MHDMLATFHQFRFHILAFFLLVILHAMIPLHAEEALPADVAKVVAKANADIDDIQSKADGEKFKVRKALIATLTKAQEKVIKSGNLDGANAIKAKVAELEKLTAAPDLLSTAPLDGKRFLAGIAGSWKVSIASGYQGVWTFTDKGTVTNTEGNKGTVKVVKNVLTVTWDIGVIETVDTYETLDKGTGMSGHGAALTITRQPSSSTQH